MADSLKTYCMRVLAANRHLVNIKMLPDELIEDYHNAIENVHKKSLLKAYVSTEKEFYKLCKKTVKCDIDLSKIYYGDNHVESEYAFEYDIYDRIYLYLNNPRKRCCVQTYNIILDEEYIPDTNNSILPLCNEFINAIGASNALKYFTADMYTNKTILLLNMPPAITSVGILSGAIAGPFYISKEYLELYEKYIDKCGLIKREY
jgi:hypothetical protein